MQPMCFWNQENIFFLKSRLLPVQNSCPIGFSDSIESSVLRGVGVNPFFRHFLGYAFETLKVLKSVI